MGGNGVSADETLVRKKLLSLPVVTAACLPLIQLKKKEEEISIVRDCLFPLSFSFEDIKEGYFFEKKKGNGGEGGPVVYDLLTILQ